MIYHWIQLLKSKTLCLGVTDNRFQLPPAPLYHKHAFTQSYQALHALHLLTLFSSIDFLIHSPLETRGHIS